MSQKVYGDSGKWTVIFYANQDRIGAGNSIIVPGQSIRIPCLSGERALPVEATATATVSAPTTITQSGLVDRLEFLTADDYAPFTDRALSGGGLITDVVASAMAELNKDEKINIGHKISWVNDWSAHLNPLLTTRAFDLGFPWFKPPCENFDALDKSAQFRCRRLFFSDPIFEPLILFFVKKDSTFNFRNDAEVAGRSICRPAGYFTFDLDQDGRNWVKDNKVTMVQPPSVEACFRLLESGSVDAVALNEFTGRAAMAKIGLTDQVRAIERPVSITALRIVVSKTHPHARTMLHYVNSALRKLRETGRFDRIVEKHLTRYWDSLAEQERAAKAAAAAAKTKKKVADNAASETNESGSTE
ncbi:MAG: transporter substrate-binding domain-containing protein [Pseudomonadota bacterium]